MADPDSQTQHWWHRLLGLGGRFSTTTPFLWLGFEVVAGLGGEDGLLSIFVVRKHEVQACDARSKTLPLKSEL